MTDLVYRRAEPEDIAPAAALFVEAVVDLAQRNGLTPSAPHVASIEPWYHHLRETGLFEVAVEGDALRAFAAGIVRDDLFFLSMFWTQPNRQKQGIGRPLLERVFDAARASGGRTFSVWSSIDFAALGTYLRMGMRPVGPILTFGGVPQMRSDVSPVELVPLDLETAMRIDRVVRGTERAMDHAFLAKEKRVAMRVCRGTETLGYFYAHEGRVGPVAWLEEEDGRAVLAAAIGAARESSERVTLSIPGPNRVAIDVAVEARLLIEGTSHFLTTAPFGAIERYIPSGPALF